MPRKPKTEFRYKRKPKQQPPFDMEAFLREAAGRVLERGDLPEFVREAADGAAAAALDYGYTIKTAADWPEYLSGSQLVFWPEEKRRKKERGTQHVMSFSPVRTAYDAADGKLFTGDSLLWLKTIPDESVKLVFADPPYNIGKAAWDSFPSEAAYLAWCESWISEVTRILAPSGSFYVCGFSEILADVKCMAAPLFAGCRWLIWHYKNKANLGKDWGRSHESIVHFRKSASFTLNIDDIRIPYNAHTLKYPEHPQSESSAFSHKGVARHLHWQPNPLGAKPKDVVELPTTCNGMGEKTPHPTQKPEALLRKLVLAASNPGDTVLDPFSGSGTTLVVSRQLRRKWLGCDLSDEYNSWAIERLEAVPDKPLEYWISIDREISARRESIR